VPTSFRIGEFHVEPSLYRVSGPAGTVRLEPKVMQVLLCLTEHGDQVVSKDRLMRAVWSDTFVSDDVLTRAISELRRVFGDDVKHPRLIETIPKSGYRLMAPVSFTSPDDNGVTKAQAVRTPTLQSRPDSVLAAGEATDGARVRSRARLGSWKRALATMAVVAAVLLAGVVAQRMPPRSSARVVRSVRLTFTGQVDFPALEAAFFPAFGRLQHTRVDRAWTVQGRAQRHVVARRGFSILRSCR
jgi:DNA-binding winged helix-turn-helix (wHTH) protein